MKVICINSRFFNSKNGETYDAVKLLVEGNVYTVIDTVTSIRNEVGYILLEIKSPGLKGSFSATRFIPCSDINEKILTLEQQH